MLRKKTIDNHRPSLGLILLVFVILLVYWNHHGPLSSLTSPYSNDSALVEPPNIAVDVEPRLDTFWHRQIARESVNDKTGLTAVETPYGKLNRTRVALLMEDRPLPYLIPLLLHFISVVPPEWSFRFMGSEASISLMKSNPTIRAYIEGQKLFLDAIPDQIVETIDSYRAVSHLLSSSWLYEEWLWPAEWLFLFQDDSMICSASKRTVNDFVDEDWSFLGVSAYSHETPHSTGGGFSLRKVPDLIKLIKTYSYDEWVAAGRVPSEDYYFSMALWDQPWAKMPTGEDAIRWGAVVHFHEDPNEMPLGFHPYSSDGMFRGVHGQENQEKAYAYCPELAIISVGRWDCKCSPDKKNPGGLGG